MTRRWAPGPTAAAAGLSSGFHLLEERLVLVVAFLFELRHRNEPERSRVDAIAESGRPRSVVEQMAQVRVARRGAHLDPPHPVRVVRVLRNVRVLDGAHEAP